MPIPGWPARERQGVGTEKDKVEPGNRKAARGTTAVAVTAAFLVLRRDAGGAEHVMTLLTDLFDVELSPHRAWRLPTYTDAIRAATDRALSREPVVAVVPAMGTVKLVPVCERLVLGSAAEFDDLTNELKSRLASH